ncbi:hypothetical protein [Cognatiluteimonas weifangensis]|uniref:Lipoprotein n=1 Tax=Cognatiluteimonas weifangensis TaxID=2303539 RepID=A0A372DPG6_9GAMM|nr:hypothetical protein [Luteimonas weifangensis]RFP61419.1 hypothetical protein D0Y53_03585 [Luteimonas weifangensis]
MRGCRFALVLAILAAAGCGSRGGDPAPPAPLASVPAAEHGKLGTDQVGVLSPVAAFEGGGADWRIEIRADGGLRHGVRLQRGATGDPGSARYRPAAGTAAPGEHRLEGTLYTASGDRAMRIELQRGECRDAAAHTWPWRVRVEVDGLPSLHGCGELAQ